MSDASNTTSSQGSLMERLQDHVSDLSMALQELYLSTAMVRLRVQEHANTLTKFSEWSRNTRTMQSAEILLQKVCNTKWLEK